MSTTTRNEAAERLRDRYAKDPIYFLSDLFGLQPWPDNARLAFDAVLVAERRATVERIREGYHGDKSHWFGQWLDSLLDEEAAR